ncbi:aspartate aminotransferase family protein [Rouxiella badensis]|jgi:succinylornithine aminotransferase|uniref:Acetylornithine/succinyldiaminopimelate aminotransferase n=1 Tax=Rouxiella badensis TaxID=1646377 RepID=A0A1X0WGF9_9GAMM|nr:aspartate aminotransferase family protein [Rouxiella badensis]MCC3719448.1 aspartate aminotransferase family protein [Rouxiella badensis]MCC3728698.1 aspartate aminotransferase family protein [Rouxiella badensis]MCC3734269.1 aspartate aminotransferase family protein [Rouxiella badensis]MCC3739306.1 aspartate aminotransferase family protein [Rouxiella badensis]MCC3747262.1 aspartate aminotransferase family protein [Rouxiella badensis]
MEQRVTRKAFDEYMVPVYAPADFIPVRGEGSWLWDQSGKDYVDFAGGIAVNALGHRHPEVLSALTEQAQKVWHLGNGYTNEPVLKLAKQLVDATFADKAFFCNSGAEANEAALKLARLVGHSKNADHKNEIIAFKNAFHGRTLFTVSAGGQPKYSQDFAPLPPAITHLPFNDLSAVANHISSRTCAVIVEPVQGEGGVVPADPEFLHGLRALCDQHDAVLIFDEVQTGVGRTGELYAYQAYDVVPDILTTAKALGGGFPIGAMLTVDSLAAHFQPGTHGTTYGGNPLATAVAGKVFELINTPEVLGGVALRHLWFTERLNLINHQYHVFSEIRGMGLLLGAVMHERYNGQAKQLNQLAAEEGLIGLIAGPNVLRFAPSLIIPQADVEEGLNRLERAIARLCS